MKIREICISSLFENLKKRKKLICWKSKDNTRFKMKKQHNILEGSLEIKKIIISVCQSFRSVTQGNHTPSTKYPYPRIVCFLPVENLIKVICQYTKLYKTIVYPYQEVGTIDWAINVLGFFFNYRYLQQST